MCPAAVWSGFENRRGAHSERGQVPVCRGVNPMVRKQARNFTLLEVLIVLAIVGMLAALVTVPFARHLGSAEVQGAASQVQSALSDAQAEARESGLPVRVVATVDENGRTDVACQTVDPFAPERGDLALDSAPESRAQAEPRSGMEHAFARATRRVQLPTGITIQDRQPAEAPEIRRSVGGMAAAPEGTDARSSLVEARPPRTLAIFLPDGSAVVPGPIRLSGKDGRSSEVRVNPWTGVAVLSSENNAGVTDADSAGPRPSGAGSSGSRTPDPTDPFAEWR